MYNSILKMAGNFDWYTSIRPGIEKYYERVVKKIPIDDFVENAPSSYSKEIKRASIEDMSSKIRKAIIDSYNYHMPLNGNNLDKYIHELNYKSLKNMYITNFKIDRVELLFRKKNNNKVDIPNFKNLDNENQATTFIARYDGGIDSEFSPNNFIERKVFTDIKPTKLVQALDLSKHGRTDIVDLKGIFGQYDSVMRSKNDNDLTIVFSKKPEDISAMSSRSYWTSCQGVDSTSYSSHSKEHHAAMNENVGIIFLTNNNDYKGRGSEMIARSLIYYGEFKGEPVIYISQTYASNKKIADIATSLFETSIKKHTSLKVILGGTRIDGLVQFKGISPYIDNTEYLSNIPEHSELETEYLKGKESTGSTMNNSLLKMATKFEKIIQRDEDFALAAQAGMLEDYTAWLMRPTRKEERKGPRTWSQFLKDTVNQVSGEQDPGLTGKDIYQIKDIDIPFSKWDLVSLKSDPKIMGTVVGIEKRREDFKGITERIVNPTGRLIVKWRDTDETKTVPMEEVNKVERETRVFNQGMRVSLKNRPHITGVVIKGNAKSGMLFNQVTVRFPDGTHRIVSTLLLEPLTNKARINTKIRLEEPIVQEQQLDELETEETVQKPKQRHLNVASRYSRLTRLASIVSKKKTDEEDLSDEEYYEKRMTEEELEDHYKQKFFKALMKVTLRNSKGTLLLVSDVRREAGIPKKVFDKIALEQNRNGTIVLHHTDYPASMSKEELDACVKAEQDYFIGMAVRQFKD